MMVMMMMLSVTVSKHRSKKAFLRFLFLNKKRVFNVFFYFSTFFINKKLWEIVPATSIDSIPLESIFS